MTVNEKGDVGAGSFYAKDQTVIPWNLTNPIYKYVAVTLIVSNLNTSINTGPLSLSAGINILGAAPGPLQFKIILIVQGVQRSAPAIASDVESVFGMQTGSFTTLASNPLNLPVSVFGANLESNPYSNFVGKFVQETSAKQAVIGKYSAALLETSSSGIFFNSVESVTYPLSQLLTPRALDSVILGGAFQFGQEFDAAFGFNSTGVVAFQKKVLDFSQPQDHTLSFGALIGLTYGVTSATNETFAIMLPGGAEIMRFNPSIMLVQSSSQSILLVGAFPWIGTAPRLLPDVSVTFHYPAFDSPVLSVSWSTAPAPPNIGQNFTLTLGITNNGAIDAKNLVFYLGYSGVDSWDKMLSNYSSLSYNVSYIAKGATNNHRFHFQSFAPEADFYLYAYFTDAQNFGYEWQTQFTIAPNALQLGPLTVTKSVTPTNPTYGQVGNVTVTIRNPTSSTYYNVQDLNPDAWPILYPGGFGNNPPPGTAPPATTIGPAGTLTLSYPYFFNLTGSIALAPERIAYSHVANLPITNATLVGEYLAQSPPPPPLIVGLPPILPIVDTTMNATELNFLYLVQDQGYVRINVGVKNTGVQAAMTVVVSSLIPRAFDPNSYCSSCPPGPQLPLVKGGNATANGDGTIGFAVAILQPGEQASAWYIVKANTTVGFFETHSNVTAQASDGGEFRLSYSGPVLGVYFSPAYTLPPPQQGSLETTVTMDRATIASGSSTVVTVHLYNEANVTLTGINATVQNGFGSPLTFTLTSELVPDMPAGSSRTVGFTAVPSQSVVLPASGWTTGLLYGTVYYNTSSTTRAGSNFSQNVMIYNSTISGFNPSLRVDISTTTPQVPEGGIGYAILTVTNTGLSNVTRFTFYLHTPPYPLSDSHSAPETIYGFDYAMWLATIRPGESVSFRVGIRTRGGGLYPVYSTYLSYNFNSPNPTPYGIEAQISASSAALITATDTTGPSVSIPWTSPFAPSSDTAVQVRAQLYDGSGLGHVNLEYTTDRAHWIPVVMTPSFSSYMPLGYLIANQLVPPFFGDVYNATIPPQSSDTIVYYRIRATDLFGNVMIQDNNGLDYLYSIQGAHSVVIDQLLGTNLQLNLSKYIPTLHATITLSVSTPISIQVTQLSSNPGGNPPSGSSALGIYVQINANASIYLAARIRFYYTSSQIQGLNAGDIAPYYWDGTNWLALNNVVVNTSEMWAEGTVTHFSVFALFTTGPAQTQPPPTQPPTQTTNAQPPWLIIGVTIAILTVATVGGLLQRTRSRKLGQVSMLETSAPTPPAATRCPSSP